MPHKYVYKQFRDGWRRAARFLSHRVLHLDDTPHRIALGVAIGFFIAWTPLLGGHMLLALICCALLRANKLAGVSFVWVCNPLTILPIYYSSYRIGCVLLPGMGFDSGRWSELIDKLLDESVPIWSRVHELGTLSWDIAVPLVVGCTICGLLMGVLAYWVTYSSVTRHRRRMAMHRLEEAAAALVSTTAAHEPAAIGASKGSSIG